MMPLLGKLSGKKERSPSTNLPQRPSTASGTPSPGLPVNNNSSTDLVSSHARVQSLDLAADAEGGGGVGDKRLVAGLISGMPLAIPGQARTPVGEGSLTLEQFGEGGDATTTFGPSPGKLSVAVPRAPELIVEVATPSSLSSTPDPARGRTISNSSLASPADRSGSTSRGLSPSRRPSNVRQLSASEYGTAATQPSAGLGLHGQSYSEFGAGPSDESTSPSQPGSRRTSAVNGASRNEFAASASTGNLASYSMSSSSSSLPHSTSAPHNLAVAGTPRRQSSLNRGTGSTDDGHSVYGQQPTMSPEASPPPVGSHHLPSKQMSLASVTSLGSRKNRSNTQASMGGIAGAIAMSGVALAAHSSQPVMANVVNGAVRPAVSRQTSRSDMAADESRDAQRHGRLPSEDQSIDDGSEYGYSGRGSYDGFTSGIGLGSLDDVSSLLGTGYAVASSKRNADFHQLFKQVPEDDYLIEDYGCALQREILIQGRLYISEHHLCFHANILGWVTTLVVPFSEVLRYEKRMTALIIPNAIQISTMHARHTFASFLSRDTTYDLIANIWRHTHPDVPASAALPDTASAIGGETDDDGPGLSADENVTQTPSKKKKEKKSRKDKEKEKADKKAAAAMPANAPQAAASVGNDQAANGGSSDSGPKSKSKSKKAKAAPHCETSAPIEKEFEDISILCVDTVFPSTPEKIYNLMFTSGFMKTFWVENQKLTELEIGDWSPKAASHLLTRHMSYIKPLSAPVGPKSTKCKITDENHHVDFDDYIVTISTTETPDVPSGNAFSVKTRTCLTWTKNNHTRVYITTAVRWTGRSFLKGVINSSAIDGQKTYYAQLEKAMRAYIQQHRSEFATADDADEDDDAEASSLEDASKAGTGQTAGDSISAADTAAKPGPGTTAAEKAWWEDYVGSTAASILRPLFDIAAGLLDSVLEASPGQLALGLIVLVLIISNLVMLRGSSDVAIRPAARGRPSRVETYERLETDYDVRAPRRAPGRGGEDIALAVRGALDDWLDAQTRTGRLHSMPNSFGSNRNDRQGRPALADTPSEVDAISQSIDALEERLAILKENLRLYREVSAGSAHTSPLPS